MLRFAGKLLIKEDVGVTGCSSRMYELTKRNGGVGVVTGNDKSMSRYLTKRGDAKLRMTGLVFPSVPNLDKDDLPPTKMQKGEYMWFKLKQGKDTIGMFCHPTTLLPRSLGDVLMLKTKEDMLEHMPWWVLRPWKLFDLPAMVEQGFMRVIKGETVPNGPYGFRNKAKKNKGSYGYNRTNALKKLKTIELDSMDYSGYWGKNPQYTTKFNLKSGSKQAVSGYQPGYGATANTDHISRDLGDMFDSVIPWWAKTYAGGYKNVTPEEIVKAAGLAAKERLEGRFKPTKLAMAGGCWNCGGEADSIRIVMAFAERLVKRGDGAVSKKCAFITVDGTRIYYAIHPYVYESPQHGDHAVSCMYFSLKPLYFEQAYTS